VKNIQIISSADADQQELFAATEEEFALFFRPGENIAFMERLAQHAPKVHLYAALSRILARPVIAGAGIAVDGILFYERRAPGLEPI
jgi:hypothetical protein